MPKMNDALIYWTADEVAECLPISDKLGGKLYDFLADAEDPTPWGGDGSPDSRGIATVETPDGRLDDHDDQAPHWWGRLTEAEQAEINAAYEKEYGDG